MEDLKVNIRINGLDELDEMEKKASRLVELLEEAQHIVDSLFKGQTP